LVGLDMIAVDVVFEDSKFQDGDTAARSCFR
jgi:hypothetical protein